MASVLLRNIAKRYDDTEVLRNVNLDIADGEFVVFVGPSGCGKSTLMRMIAGLEDISSGDLLIDGAKVNDVPSAKRGIAMVFQSYALYPHMTLYDNMAFGLKLAGAKKPEIDQAVKQAAKILHIDHLLDRKPKQLSGGQRQRVAIGRAITRKPKVFLFDEPLSNLDAALRVKMRLEFARLHDELKTTMIYVTHDQVEAMTLGDRIAVMKDGVVQQFGAPQEIYDSPSNLFVAGFIGAPPMNFINGKLVEQGSGIALEIDTGVKRGALNLPFDAAKLKSHVGREVILGLRPERITDVRHAHNGDASHLQPFDVRVDVTEPTGPDTHVFAQVNGKRIVSRVHPAADPQPAQTLSLLFDVSKAVLFDPASEERIA